jgi:hypothetical protein
VLPVDFPDPFTTNVLRAMPATLASYCPGSSCSAATPDFAGEAVALANELEAAPVSGRVHLASGGTTTVRVSGDDLLSTLIQADLDPGLAAELPAAVHAARAGVPGPLLRLVYLTARLGIEPEKDLGTGLYAATTCDDGLFPWSPETPVTERPSAIAAAIAALPPGALGPFGTWAAHSGSAEFCKLWPTPAGRTPLGAGPLPDVPVLAISGGLDLRTPTADAARVASLFPHGHLLLVPGVGHSVLTNDFSFCSQRAVRSWLTGGPIPSVCGRVSAFVAPLGPFPARPASRAPATTLAVASATIREAVAAWLQTQGSSGARTFPGLAGGKLVPAKRFSGFTLVRYALAPGVQVSGTLRWISPTLPFAFRGTVRVTGGAAAAGKLRVLRHRLTGTLGGRRVAGHV